MARRKRRDSMAPLQRNQPQQQRGPVVNNQAVSAFNADAEVAELDVVIPVYGRPDLLQQCLIGLEASCIDVDYRLYVVDDASPNPSEMAVVYNSLPPNSRLHRQTQNRHRGGPGPEPPNPFYCQGFPPKASKSSLYRHNSC